MKMSRPGNVQNAEKQLGKTEFVPGDDAADVSYVKNGGILGEKAKNAILGGGGWRFCIVMCRILDI